MEGLLSPEEFRSEFGAVVRASGRTITRWAEQLGVGRTTLYRWLNGPGAPRPWGRRVLVDRARQLAAVPLSPTR